MLEPKLLRVNGKKMRELNIPNLKEKTKREKFFSENTILLETLASRPHSKKPDFGPISSFRG